MTRNYTPPLRSANPPGAAGNFTADEVDAITTGLAGVGNAAKITVFAANDTARLALGSAVQIGDDCYQQDTKITWLLIGADPSNPVNWIEFSSGLLNSAVATHTTASLSVGSTEQSVLAFSKAGHIMVFQTSIPARVELYKTAAAQTADSSRPFSTRPSAGQGVIVDLETGVGALTWEEDVLFSNGDSPQVGNLYLSVTPLVTPGPVTVTFTYLQEF